MNQFSRASKGYARFCTSSSASMLRLLSWCLSGTPNIGRYCTSDSFDSMWDSYLPVGFPCPDSVWGLLSSHTVYCFVVFDCCMLFFSEEGMEGKKIWKRREEWRELEGGKTMVRLYCIKEESYKTPRRENAGLVHLYHIQQVLQSAASFCRSGNLYDLPHETTCKQLRTSWMDIF